MGKKYWFTKPGSIHTDKHYLLFLSLIHILSTKSAGWVEWDFHLSYFGLNLVSFLWGYSGLVSSGNLFSGNLFPGIFLILRWLSSDWANVVFGQFNAADECKQVGCKSRLCAGSPESPVFHSILHCMEYPAVYSSFIQLYIQQLMGTGISLHTVSHHVLRTVRIL